MESVAAFLVVAAIGACLAGAARLCAALFFFALVLVALLLYFHATDSLPLNF